MKYKLGKIDLSQIECRLLNTVAGQWDIVEKFRNGQDLYSELATQFYGFPVSKDKPAERGTGKQLELSCGYGAGGATIVRTARAGTYGPPVYLTDEQGLAARDLYRGTHKNVTLLWERANRMLWHLMDGATVKWGDCMTVHDHRIFHNESGLWLDFTTLERFTPDPSRDGTYSGIMYAGSNEFVPQEQWRHRVRNGWRKTYGARLTENVIQWLARLVISQAMVRVSQQLGLKIPLTIHDDLILLIPVERVELFDEAVKLVAQPLSWLPKCPIAVEAKFQDDLE